MLNRTVPPPIHHAVEFDYKLPPIHQQSLDNGLPLWWLAAGVQEVAEVTLAFPAGLWQEPKPAVAQATAGLIKNGTATRTAHQLSEAVEFYGASLKAGVGNDVATISLFCLTRHLPALLPIVKEIITEASFPEAEVALYKQNSIQRLSVSLRQCEFVADQRIDALLYGEAHPYGRFSKTEKLEALTRADLTAFHQQAWALGNATIFMTGRIGAGEVQLVNEAFGREPVILNPAVADQLFSPAPPAERKQRIVNDAAGVQGAIRMARPSITRTHPDYPRLVVLNTLFGGYFGSRLMSNIREDKGYTYGIYSSLNSWYHGADMTIHTEAGRDVCEAAITEVYKEMQALCDEPAEEDELLLVKNYLLGGLLGDLDSPFQTLSRWRTLILNGQDEDTFHRNVNIYKTITAAEVQALAQQYYKPEEFFELVVV